MLSLEDFGDPINDAETQELYAFLELTRRPWSNRRRIVQEIGLARKANIYCGNTSTSWQNFSNAVSLFASRNGGPRKLFQGAKEFPNHPDLLGEAEALRAQSLVLATDNLVRKSENGTVMERLYSLEALMSMLTGFEASAPHDTCMPYYGWHTEPDPQRSGAYNENSVSNTPNPGSPILQTVSSNDQDVQALGLNGAATDIDHPPLSTSDADPIPNILARTDAVLDAAEASDRSRQRDASPSLTGLTRPSRGRSASDRSPRAAEQPFRELFQEGPEPIQIDYGKSAYDVCRQSLEFAAMRSKSLDMIYHP